MTKSNDSGGQCCESVTLSGKELIILFLVTPVVFIWLLLIARIIRSDNANSDRLDNMKGVMICQK